MAKEIHIVQGYSGKETLLQSNCVDFSSSDKKLLVVMDNFSEGKLYNLKTLEGVEERAKWFEDFYNEPNYGDWSRRDNAGRLRQELREINTTDTVYIWLGNEGNEYLGKIAIVDFLADLKIPIYVIDWSEVFVENNYGNTYNATYLPINLPKNVPIIKSKFRLLTETERVEWSNIWGSLCRSNADLRILNAKLEIEEGDVSFFDEMILAHCSEEFMSAPYIVGRMLGAIWNTYNGAGIGDIFLFERIKQLAILGVVEIANQQYYPAAGHSYDVRRIKE